MLTNGQLHHALGHDPVEPHYGCGQSGFIGLDGWKSSEPPETPYGTVAPGIFQLGNKHTGPLGGTEAAMVIADLDLLRTTDQKPRPQYQSRPLRLVAHLPLIFASEPAANTGDQANPRRGDRFRMVPAAKCFQTFKQAARFILEALHSDSAWRSVDGPRQHDKRVPSTYSTAIEATGQALRILEVFADDAGWLVKRRNAFEHARYEQPSQYPLPALLDWIYVDDRWSPNVEQSSLSAKHRGESGLESDHPILSVPRSADPEPERGAN